MLLLFQEFRAVFCQRRIIQNVDGMRFALLSKTGNPRNTRVYDQR